MLSLRLNNKRRSRCGFRGRGSRRAGVKNTRERGPGTVIAFILEPVVGAAIGCALFSFWLFKGNAKGLGGGTSL